MFFYNILIQELGSQQSHTALMQDIIGGTTDKLQIIPGNCLEKNDVDYNLT